MLLLSVFAESFYEMLQYEMGCRLLSFLQKLRVKFVFERKQSKRERQETLNNENEEGSSKKRVKTSQDVEDIKPIKIENKDDARQEDINIDKEEATATQKVDDANIEVQSEEEDPEEDPEEDVEMQEASHHHEPSEEKLPEVEKIDSDVVGDTALSELNDSQETEVKSPEAPINHDESSKNKVANVVSETKGTKGAIDKELLQLCYCYFTNHASLLLTQGSQNFFLFLILEQAFRFFDRNRVGHIRAFRFFDRNRVGHIRAEDLKLIIHNLGKFLSNGDVKELVHSALLQSNTGRDDKILYEKLVKISDL